MSCAGIVLGRLLHPLNVYPSLDGIPICFNEMPDAIYSFKYKLSVSSCALFPLILEDSVVSIYEMP